MLRVTSIIVRIYILYSPEYGCLITWLVRDAILLLISVRITSSTSRVPFYCHGEGCPLVTANICWDYYLIVHYRFLFLYYNIIIIVCVCERNKLNAPPPARTLLSPET